MALPERPSLLDSWLRAPVAIMRKRHRSSRLVPSAFASVIENPWPSCRNSAGGRAVTNGAMSRGAVPQELVELIAAHHPACRIIASELEKPLSSRVDINMPESFAPQIAQVFAVDAEALERCYPGMCDRIGARFFPPG